MYVGVCEPAGAFQTNSSEDLRFEMKKKTALTQMDLLADQKSQVHR